MRTKALFLGAMALVAVMVAFGAYRESTSGAGDMTRPIQPFYADLSLAGFADTTLGAVTPNYVYTHIPYGVRISIPWIFSGPGYTTPTEAEGPGLNVQLGGIRTVLDVLCNGVNDYMVPNFDVNEKYPWKETTTAAKGTDADFLYTQVPPYPWIFRDTSNPNHFLLGGVSQISATVQLNTVYTTLPFSPNGGAGTATTKNNGNPHFINGPASALTDAESVCIDSPENTTSLTSVNTNPPLLGDTGPGCSGAGCADAAVYGPLTANTISGSQTATVTANYLNRGPSQGTFTETWDVELTNSAVVTAVWSNASPVLNVTGTVLNPGTTVAASQPLTVTCNGTSGEGLVVIKTVLWPQTGTHDYYPADNANFFVTKVVCGSVGTAVDKQVVEVVPVAIGATALDSTPYQVNLVIGGAPALLTMKEVKANNTNINPVPGHEWLAAEAAPTVPTILRSWSNAVDVTPAWGLVQHITANGGSSDTIDFAYSEPPGQSTALANLSVSCPGGMAEGRYSVVVKAIDAPTAAYDETNPADNAQRFVIMVNCWTSSIHGQDGIDDGTGLYARWTIFQSNPDGRLTFASPPSFPSDQGMDTKGQDPSGGYIERTLDLECFWHDANGCSQSPDPTAGTADVAVTTTTGPPGTLTDTRAAWTVNMWVGGTVTSNSKTMVVTSNTATTVTGTAGWSGGGNPGNGNAYTIVDPVISCDITGVDALGEPVTGAPGSGDGYIDGAESHLDYNLVALGGWNAIDADNDCLVDQGLATTPAKALQPGHPVDLLTKAGTCPDFKWAGPPEKALNTYSNAEDQDCDGVPDGVEVAYGSNPLASDSDSDGATDFQEMFQFTNPNNPDTDGDGYLDAPSSVFGDNVTITGTANVAVTTTGSSTGTLTDTRASWVVNGLVGGTVTTLADPLIPCVAKSLKVTSNTASTLTGTAGWSGGGNPGNGCAYSMPSTPWDNCPAVANPTQANTDGGHRLAGPVIPSGIAANPNKDRIGNACDPDNDNDGIPDVIEPVMSTGIYNSDTNYNHCVDGSEISLSQNPNIFYSGTAAGAVTTGTSPATLTDTRAAWTVNQWATSVVTTNGKTMTVASNTATTLTGTGSGWSGGGNPGNGNAYIVSGAPCPTGFTLKQADFFRACHWNLPANGAYGGLWNGQYSPILSPRQELDPDGDSLNCTVDGLIVNANEPDNDNGTGTMTPNAPAEVTDTVEVEGYNTNPAMKDTDGDGCDDWAQINDVNGDGLVNVGDQLSVAKRVANVAPFLADPVSDGILDVNRDNKFNVGDNLQVAKNTCSLKATLGISGGCGLAACKYNVK